MTGTTPRQQLAAQILADNSEWIVKPYPFEPKQVQKGKPVVSVYRPEISPAAQRTHLAHDLEVVLYASKVADEAAENELDELLDQLMLSLERYSGCHFTSAKRRNLVNNTFAGFVVSAQCISPNVYRETIIQERSTP